MSSGPFINRELLDRVQKVRETELDKDIRIKEARNARDLSELYRRIMNMDETEKIVCIAAILENDSNLIHRVMEEERQSLRKGRKQ